ncbi:MAG: hypothetical protein OJF59_002054 [Cytophagales bacterium]|nr:MAG: hypothetical protein OJF59_002054 [Cytophagales bacterium]
MLKSKLFFKKVRVKFLLKSQQIILRPDFSNKVRLQHL